MRNRRSVFGDAIFTSSKTESRRTKRNADTTVCIFAGKHCPNCGAFIQKNDGCNIMMCGTTAHGRLADALAHGGCGHLFHWCAALELFNACPHDACVCPEPVLAKDRSYRCTPLEKTCRFTLVWSLRTLSCRDSLKPAKTFYIGLDGQRVDNYIGGIATDGAGMMP